MKQSLTLLQRGVIQRLRERHYSSLADAAHDAWSHGERVNLPPLISERDAELRADFQRADEQASPPPDDRSSARLFRLSRSDRAS